jgi:hypothetical protein
MPSIFSGKTTLRTSYSELGFSDITLKNAASSVLLMIARNETSMVSIYNGVNTPIYIQLVNPKDESATKLFWTVLEQGQSFNLDSIAGRMLTFPAETKFYIHTNGIAAASGKVRASVLG